MKKAPATSPRLSFPSAPQTQPALRKTSSRRRVLTGTIAAAVVSVAAVQSAKGAVYFWDADGNPLNDSAAPGIGALGVAGTNLGGTGTWDATSPLWFRPAYGSAAATSQLTPADTVWSNSITDVAEFMGTAGTVTINSALNAGAIRFFTNGYTLSGTGTLTLGAGFGGTVNAAANIFAISGASETINNVLTGTNGLTLGGGGTVTLTNANTYTGGTTLNTGATLILDSTGATAATSNIVPSGQTLTLNNGTLSIKGNAATAGTNTFSGVTSAGQGVIALTTGTAGQTTALGAITHNVGGTLQFTTAPDTATNIVTTSNSNVNSIVGPWAFTGTATNLQYQTINSSNQIVSFTGSAVADATGLVDTTGTVNYELAAGGAAPDSASLNTIRYTGAAATLSGTTSLTLNGLLNVGTGALTLNTTPITIGSTNELVVNPAAAVIFSTAIQNNTAIPAPGALTVGGGGTSSVTLGAVNTYTGTTTVNSGATLALGVAGAINSASKLVVNGGTFNESTFADTVAGVSLTSGTISGTGALTSTTAFDVQSGTVNAVLAGSAGLVKSTAGVASLTPAAGVAESFTGGVTIKAGTLVVGVGNTLDVLGSNTITLGDTAGSGDARFVYGGSAATYANPIVLATGTTGQLSIGTTNNTTAVTFTGGITGSNSITVNGNGTSGAITFSTVAINNVGAFTNGGTVTGTGTGGVTVTLPLGLNVTEVNQMGGTAPLTFTETSSAAAIPGTIPVNILSGALNYNSAGTAAAVTNPLGSGLLTISPGGSFVFSNGGATGTFGNLITVGASATAGTAVISTNSGAMTFNGAVNFATSGAVQTLQLKDNNTANAPLALNGAVTGTGNIQLSPSNTASPITLAGAQNQTGTITNNGSSTSTSTLSGTIGTGITGISQAGANPFLVSSAVPLNSVGLNNFTSTGAGLFTISGAISGTPGGGTLTLAANSTGGITLSGAVNPTGSIVNSGTGLGSVTISGALGANVGNVTENSATSVLTLSGTNPVVAGQVFTAQNGVLEFLNTASLPGYPAPSAGRVVVANGATLALGFGSAGQFTAADVTNIIAGTFGSGGVTFSGTTAGIGLDTATASATDAAVIGNPAGMTLGLTKLGANTLTLTGANTFTGPVAVYAGSLSAATLNSVSGGAASSGLGAPTTVANGTISLGYSTNTGTLLYTGPGETSDRVINLAGTTGGGVLDQSGTGLEKFTSNVTFTGTGAKTLTLQGSTAGTGEISGTIAGGFAGSAAPLTIQKAGTGTWTLSGTGNTATTLAISGGTLDTGANGITLSDTGGATVQGNGASGGSATILGKIVLGGVGGSYNGADFGATVAGFTLNVNAVISGGPTNNLDLYSNGTTVLGAANTYQGQTQITGTTAVVTTINNSTGNEFGAGVGSSLGDPSGTSAKGNANSVIVFAGGTLRYVGAGETTDRAFDLNGGATIDQSGTGLLKFTGANTHTVASSQTITLQGSTAGTGEIAGAIVDNTTANLTSVTKTGTGMWTLSGVSTASGYTGATTVNQGTLRVTAGGLADTAISVANGATFAVVPNVNSGTAITAGNTATAAKGASLSLAAGSAFTMVDGAIGTFNIVDNASFATAPLTVGGGSLNLEVSSSGADSIAITGGTVSSNVTSGVVNLTALGSSLTPSSSYNIISGGGSATPAGVTFANGTTSELLTVGTNVYNVSLASSAGTETLVIGAATGLASVTYTGQTGGTGAVNSAWANGASNQNFASGSTAVDYANGNAVTFQDLNTVSGFIVTNPNVVVDAAGVAPSAVNVNNSSVNYTFSNASGTTGITGTTGLNKSGTGTLTLNSPNTYTGVNVLGGGLVVVNDPGALGSNNANTISMTGSTLQYGAGVTQDFSNRFTSIASQAFNIDTNGNNVTFASNINSTSGTLTKLGAGTLTLSGTNAYTGINTITAGTLAASVDANLGTNAGAGAITFSSGSTGTLLLANGFATTKLVSLTGPGIVEVDGTNSANLNGVISGAGTFTKAGTGLLTLGNGAVITNTFTGNVNVTGGLLAYTGTNTSAYPAPLGSGVKNVNLTNGGGVRVTGLGSNPTAGGVSFVTGTGGGVFDVPTGSYLQLDDAGQFGGTGDLTVQGTGTGYVFLNNQAFNFTGNVIVNSAELRLGINSVLGTATGRTITVNSGGMLNINNAGLILPATIGISLAGTGVSNAGALEATAAYTLGQNISLTADAAIGGTATLTETGVISGGFGLSKVGTNTLILSGANTYTGATTISTGTLQLGSAGTTGTLASTGTFTDNATFTVNRTNAVVQGTDFSASGITGTGGVTQAGTGSLTLNGANSFSGTLNLSAGTLQLQANAGNTTAGVSSAAGAATGGATRFNFVNGTTLQLRSDNNVTFQGLDAAGSLNGSTQTIDVRQLTGAGSNNVFTIGNSLPTPFGNAVTLNITGGNGDSLALPAFRSVTGAASNLTLNPTSANVSLIGFSNFNNTTNSSTLTLGGTSTVNSVTGVIADQGAGSTGTTGKVAVVKNNSSTWTLRGASTYTGATTVSAGILALGTGGSLGSTAISVASGATFAPVAGTSAGPAATLTLPSGTSFSSVDGTIGNFTLTGTAATTVSMTSSVLNIEVGTAANSADDLIVSGGTTNNFAGTNTVNVTTLGSLTPGTATIITANGITAANGTANFKFVNGGSSEVLNVGGTNYLLTLAGITGQEQITIALPTALYYTGQANGNGVNDSTFANPTTGFNFATGTSPNGIPANYSDNSSIVTFQDTNIVTGSNVTNGAVTVDAAGVNPTAVLVSNLGVNYTFTNASGTIGIAGAGGITKTGNGTLTLASANTYTGATAINGGVVSIGDAAALGTGAIGFSGGTLQYGAGITTDFSPRFSTAAGNLISIDTNGNNITFGTALTSFGGSLTKSGAGILTLTTGPGANTYTGPTVINGGTIMLTSTSNASSAGVLSGTPTITVNNGGTLLLQGQNDLIGYTAGKEALIINSGGTVTNNSSGNGTGTTVGRITLQNVLTMNGGTLSGTSLGDANSGAFSINAGINATSDAAGAAALISANISTQSVINFNVARGTNVSGSQPDLIVSGPITPYSATGANGIIKSGNGILTLSGANTYKTSTQILAGTVVLGSSTGLGNVANNLVFGNSTNAALNTNGGNLDLSNASATLALLSVLSNTTNNMITIGSGKTLTLTGGITEGLDVATAAGAQSGLLTVSGAGSLAVTGGSVQLGVSQTVVNAANSNADTLDVSGLTGGFTAAVTNFNVGQGNDTTGTALLSNTSNTITASILNVASSNGNNPGPGGSVLTLGTGTNVINADTINIGLSKAVGSISFASQASGSPGTLTIGNKLGTAAGAVLDIGDTTGTGTAGAPTGTLDLRGHSVTVTGAALSLGTGVNTAAGSVNGTLSFDTGTISVASVNAGSKGGAGGTGTATGTLNVSGTGALTVRSGGSFVLATNSAATGSAAGNLNLTGGSVISNVDITKGGGTNTTATITLNGGLLDLTGHNIGSATQSINNVNLQSGTLQNVAEINNGAGVTKTTSGTLIVDGTNSFTGATTISAGTLQLGAGSTTGTLAAAATIVDNGTFAINRTNAVVQGTDFTSASITGTGGVTHAGTGSVTLNNNNNSFTGATTVSSTGTLLVSGSLSGTTSVAVNNGGTLILSGASETLGALTPSAPGSINNSASVSLGGNAALTSTLRLTGTAQTESVGALTLGQNSAFDLGLGATSNSLVFSSLAASSGANLAVVDWTGNLYDRVSGTDNGTASQDRLLFTVDPGETFANSLSFYSDAGALLGMGHDIPFGGAGGGYEIVPIPEPSSVLYSGLLILGLAGYRERRRFRKARPDLN